MKTRIERALKWLLPALVLSEIFLVRARLLAPRAAVGLVIVVEVLLVLVGGRQVFTALRRYRRNRAAGLQVWEAVEDGLAVLLPRRVARVVTLEPRLWVCLAQWLFMRWPRGAGAYSYHKGSPVGVFLVVVVFTMPVELLIPEIFIYWVWLRWTLLFAGVYGLLWIVSYYASLVVLPHQLQADGVQLRYGALAQGFIPYAEILHIEQARRRAPRERDGLMLAPDGSSVSFAIAGKTDVILRLRTALPMQRVFGPTPPVRTVLVAADAPEGFVRELTRRIAALTTPAQPALTR